MPPPRIGSPRRGRFTPAQRGGPARLGDAAQRGGSAHRALHERAQREALRLAEMERAEWLAARDRCLQLEKIRTGAQDRLATIRGGAPERFAGERAFAEAALRDVAQWELRDSPAYTILSFASRRDRLRYLRGGAEREAVLRECLACGGIRDDRGRFQEILR